MAACDLVGQPQSSCTEDRTDDTRPKTSVMFVCEEWKSSKGGLSTFNREYAVNLAKTCPDKINVYCYVAQSDDEDREDARKKHVTLLKACKLPGTSNRHDWLKIPPPELPNPDVVIGHGRKFGIPAYFIRRSTKSRWIHILHVFCQDLGRYKVAKSLEGSKDTIHENEVKHKHEIELSEVADAVIAVGDQLHRKYRNCIPETTVEVVIPGISDSFPLFRPPDWRLNPEDEDEVFSIVVSGRAALEDRQIKGYDIIANAVGLLGVKFQLEFVGCKPGEQRIMEDWFLGFTKITRDQLTVHSFVDREEMKKKLKEHALFVLPSRTEAFGFAALEAISAGIPVLISEKTGIAQVLQKLENGHSFIVSSDDAQEWAKRIEQLSRQKPDRRYENARQLRENYNTAYTWDAACKKLSALIENLEREDEKSAEPMADKENIMKEASEVSSVQWAAPVDRKQLRAEADVELQNDTPVVVQATLWRYIGEIFGRQPHTESRCLRWGDLSLKRDSVTGKEKLVWNNASSKPHQAQGELGNCNLQSMAVQSYKEFASHRPQEMNQPNSPFYLAVKRKRKREDDVWYMKKAQAVGKIGKMLTDKKRPRPSL